MNIIHFLIAIRWQNVVITWLMQSVMYFLYVLPYCGKADYSFPSYLLFSIVTGMVLSGGNIYNDIQDIHTDLLQKNRPKIIGHKITIKRAWMWYLVLTGAAIILSAGGSFIYGWPIHFLLIILLGIVLLYLYSTHLKKTILVGNIVIGLLCALAIWMTIYLAPSCGLNLGFSGSGRIPIILTGYIINAFLITILREVIKDKEDATADMKAGIVTVGSVPDKQYKMIVNGLLIIITLINILWFYYLLPVLNGADLILGLVLIFIPLILMNFIFNQPPSSKKYSLLSQLIKVYIVLAIVLLILWQRG